MIVKDLYNLFSGDLDLLNIVDYNNNVIYFCDYKLNLNSDFIFNLIVVSVTNYYDYDFNRCGLVIFCEVNNNE